MLRQRTLDSARRLEASLSTVAAPRSPRFDSALASLLAARANEKRHARRGSFSDDKEVHRAEGAFRQANLMTARKNAQTHGIRLIEAILHTVADSVAELASVEGVQWLTFVFKRAVSLLRRAVTDWNFNRVIAIVFTALDRAASACVHSCAANYPRKALDMCNAVLRRVGGLPAYSHRIVVRKAQLTRRIGGSTGASLVFLSEWHPNANNMKARLAQAKVYLRLGEVSTAMRLAQNLLSDGVGEARSILHAARRCDPRHRRSAGCTMSSVYWSVVMPFLRQDRFGYHEEYNMKTTLQTRAALAATDLALSQVIQKDWPRPVGGWTMSVRVPFTPPTEAEFETWWNEFKPQMIEKRMVERVACGHYCATRVGRRQADTAPCCRCAHGHQAQNGTRAGQQFTWRYQDGHKMVRCRADWASCQWCKNKAIYG